MELTDILRCPSTGNRLRFGDGDTVVRVHGSDVTYPAADGMIDFCPHVSDRVSKAYDRCSSLYDAYMASAVYPGMFRKIIERLVWGFYGDGGVMESALSHLPAEFDGVLLDVPVGTGLFTCSRYARYPNATIIAIDYSRGMLREARKRFLKHGVSNVHLIRADVAHLPIADDSVDIVFSLAGLHAFADKRRAIEEMRRVLHEEGSLLAASYVSGVRKRTDWIIKYFLAPRGFFTPPFLHLDTVAAEFEGFTIREQGDFECCVWFEAVKHELVESGDG